MYAGLVPDLNNHGYPPHGYPPLGLATKVLEETKASALRQENQLKWDYLRSQVGQTIPVDENTRIRPATLLDVDQEKDSITIRMPEQDRHVLEHFQYVNEDFDNMTKYYVIYNHFRDSECQAFIKDWIQRHSSSDVVDVQG